MTNTFYVLSIAGSLLLGIALYAFRLHKAGLKPLAAAAALPLSAALGFLLAKVLYVLLQTNYVWRRWGFASFLRMNLTEFSFVGGVLGALLGVLIAGALLRLPLRRPVEVLRVLPGGLRQRLLRGERGPSVLPPGHQEPV